MPRTKDYSPNCLESEFAEVSRLVLVDISEHSDEFSTLEACYSPKCLEEKFCELRQYSSRKVDHALGEVSGG
jgi:hypothetical protein